MCIIIAKEKGVKTNIKLETVRHCFNTNRDGTGVMWSKGDGKVYVNKGFMTFQLLEDWLDTQDFWKNQEDYAIVFHSRIGTCGAVTKANTHPYPISRNISDIQNLYGAYDIPCGCHNGILREYPSFDIDKKEDLTDSAMLIRNFFSNPRIVTQLKNEEFLKRVGDNIKGSKYCFLHPDGEISYINKNEGQISEDIWYSHSGYKPYSHSSFWQNDKQKSQYVHECKFCGILTSQGYHVQMDGYVCSECELGYAEYFLN